MKRVSDASRHPLSTPLVADDFIELHVSRLLLLLKRCGVGGKIEGLTKFAKLDFFVRYPSFFQRVAHHLGAQVEVDRAQIESPMMRFHYGPWDSRYYTLLPFLEARGLIDVEKRKGKFVFSLTEKGKALAVTLEKNPAFSDQVSHMHSVKTLLGSKNGNSLKKLIYKVFEEEVSNKPMGQVIS